VIPKEDEMYVKDNKNPQVVGIYIWKGKAYLPSQAQFESGIFVDVNPVHIVNIDKLELISAIKNVKDSETRIIPDPRSQEEFQDRNDPILESTGAKNWMELARYGANYDISWVDNEVRINISRIDRKGRWEFDPNKVQVLKPNTPLEKIVDIILVDINTRPELFRK
jgi:hypothetical protein